MDTKNQNNHVLSEAGTLKYDPKRINLWHTKAIKEINFKAMKEQIGVVSEEPSQGKEVWPKLFQKQRQMNYYPLTIAYLGSKN